MSGPAAPNCCQATSPRPSRSNATNTRPWSGWRCSVPVMRRSDRRSAWPAGILSCSREATSCAVVGRVWCTLHTAPHSDTAQHLVGYARLPARLGRHQVSNLLPIRLGLLLILSCYVGCTYVLCRSAMLANYNLLRRFFVTNILVVLRLGLFV